MAERFQRRIIAARRTRRAAKLRCVPTVLRAPTLRCLPSFRHWPTCLRLPSFLRIAALLHAAVLVGVNAETAWAHSLHVFANVEGATIQGEAYFRGRLPVKNAAVRVLDPDGRPLARTTTNEQGRFTLPIARACDHRIIVETADGHAGEFVIARSELPGAAADALGSSPPPSVPTDGRATPSPPSDPAAVATGPSGASETTGAPASTPGAAMSPGSLPGGSGPALSASRLEAIERQVIELRREVDRHEQRTRLRDILGGIGYILGLAGVASYVAARRRAGARTLGRRGTAPDGSETP